MVQARSALLNSGAYAPIAGTSGAKCCALDAGCGEGFHLARLPPSLQHA
jgi:hypothetical protein